MVAAGSARISSPRGQQIEVNGNARVRPTSPPSNVPPRSVSTAGSAVRNIDEELLSLMIESFPNLDPHDIHKVILHEKSGLTMPEDRNQLHDKVVLKLQSLVRKNDSESSNCRLTTNFEEAYDQVQV